MTLTAILMLFVAWLSGYAAGRNLSQRKES